MKWIILLAYIATIPAANYLIGNVGTVCVDNVCLIPVWPDLKAPSGVLMIGLAFVFRDLVQRTFGIAWGLCCIFMGAIVSASLSPPALVIASVSAFVFGELLDFAVYTPLQKKGFVLAVAVSSVFASVVDSALFLILAFGSMDFVIGQIVGKWISIFIATTILFLARSLIIKKTEGELK